MSTVLDQNEGRFYFGQIFAHDLYEERHGKVHNSVFPSQFHDYVRSQQIVAGIQTGRETLVVLFTEEPSKQLLSNLCVATLTRILHGVLKRKKISRFFPLFYNTTTLLYANILLYKHMYFSIRQSKLTTILGSSNELEKKGEYLKGKR